VGGRGSGRRPDFGATLDDCHAIAIPCLRRHGLLQPGSRGSFHWSRAGRETGSVGVAATHDMIVLAYRILDRAKEEGWIELTERVRLVHTAQPFGGQRSWFACPECGRRCAALYCGRRFLCRRCVGVPYASQSMAAPDRLRRRARIIRQRLGGSEYANLSLEFPPKPKWMRWSTYGRLRALAERLSCNSVLASAQRLGLLKDELASIGRG
jgi:hypothetical protein